MLNKKRTIAKKSFTRMLMAACIMLSTVTVSDIHNVYASEAFEIVHGYGATDSEYVISNSDKKEIDAASLKKLSSEQLRLARNEIYARHGRLFNDPYLQEYFNSRSWYNGYISPEDFDENCLSKIENKNINKILKAEKKRKSGTDTNNGTVTFSDFIGDYRCANNGGLSFYKSESSPTGFGIATFIFDTRYEGTADEFESVRCVYPTNILNYSIDGHTVTLTYGYDSPEGTMTCVIDENHCLTIFENGSNGSYYYPIIL